MVDDADSIRHFFRNAQLMRGNEYRHAEQGAFFQNVFEHARVVRVESNHGLIEDKYFGVVQ